MDKIKAVHLVVGFSRQRKRPPLTARRRVVEARWHAGEPAPEGATAILGRYPWGQPAEDSQALLRWCEKYGLEFLVYDGATGEYFATAPLPADVPGYARH